MRCRITEITGWYEDSAKEAGDTSHVGHGQVRRLSAEEYEQKVENGVWPDIPCVYEVSDKLKPERVGERLVELYNRDHEYDYIEATECEWEEVE